VPFKDPFIDLLQVGDTEFELAAPETYVGKTDTFVVPKGEGTDLASVPIGLTWLIPRYGRYTRAAILHDYLWSHPEMISKSDADGVFRRVLRELGVSALRRWTMWAAVRLASILKHHGAKGTPLKHWLSLLVLWPTLIAFVAIPTVVVYVFTFLYKIVEWALSPFDS
jgi:hypothetical protein